MLDIRKSGAKIPKINQKNFMQISSTETAGRPRPYQVCNSRPRGKAAGYEVRRRARGEARIESVVEFEYGPICPADGTQVMEPTRKFLWLTPTEGETLGKCSVVATGEVDDYATVTIAGETQKWKDEKNVANKKQIMGKLLNPDYILYTCYRIPSLQIQTV